MSRVLVIDDEVNVCDAICRVLERGGHDVISTLDGEEGLQMCQTDPVDVVVTDIIMPNKHGIEIIQELRRKFPKVGIIAISGGGNIAVAGYQPDSIETAAYVAAAEKAGAHFCLTKPFERSDLLDCVAELAA